MTCQDGEDRSDCTDMRDLSEPKLGARHRVHFLLDKVLLFSVIIIASKYLGSNSVLY